MKCHDDLRNNPVDIGQNVGIPETKHSISSIPQPRIPLQIMVGANMLCSIGFDNQSSFLTDKIDDIRPYGLLATKLDLTHLRISQMPPQGMLGIRHVTPELFGIMQSLRSISGHGPLTLPPLRGGPLPLPQGDRGIFKSCPCPGSARPRRCGRSRQGRSAASGPRRCRSSR